MVWIAQNWPALLSLVSMVLGVAVAISHMAHKDAVATEIQAIQDVISKMVPPSPPSAPSA